MGATATDPSGREAVHLGLNGWPPLASHTTALILGVAMAHLSWSEPPPAPKLPPKSLIIHLPKATTRLAEKSFARGASVYLVKFLEGGLACRLTAESLVLLEAQPEPLVSLPFTSAGGVGEIVKEVRSGELVVKGAAAAATLPLCSVRPKVNYGPS